MGCRTTPRRACLEVGPGLSSAHETKCARALFEIDPAFLQGPGFNGWRSRSPNRQAPGPVDALYFPILRAHGGDHGDPGRSGLRLFPAQNPARIGLHGVMGGESVTNDGQPVDGRALEFTGISRQRPPARLSAGLPKQERPGSQLMLKPVHLHPSERPCAPVLGPRSIASPDRDTAGTCRPGFDTAETLRK